MYSTAARSPLCSSACMKIAVSKEPKTTMIVVTSERKMKTVGLRFANITTWHRCTCSTPFSNGCATRTDSDRGPFKYHSAVGGSNTVSLFSSVRPIAASTGESAPVPTQPYSQAPATSTVNLSSCWSKG